MSRQSVGTILKGGLRQGDVVIEFPVAVPASAGQALEWIGITGGLRGEAVPFGSGDVTAGTETEFQASVAGRRNQVDLPLSIEASSFYANTLRRVESGEAPKSAIAKLDRYLSAETDSVWENSWLRFPVSVLSRGARETLDEDLLYDRTDKELGKRSDEGRYLFAHAGETWVRVPVSYLLKLALSDFLGTSVDLPERTADRARALTSHFLNDNTSPETTSFFVSKCGNDGLAGKNVAEETGIRFLLTQLLLAYANENFRLEELGQRALSYLSPLPPVRQRELNECIPDSFYRELFMSPCLSGWDCGEEKHEYMGLCHKVLSRSQLNTLPKLREAGIIRNNLVVLPNISNTSLANNGTHVSIGSRLLTRSLAGRADARALSGEKYLGDLVTKVIEHFLPLFVGTYTAAPYRQPFAEFHPERVMGFLPHELHYTHLRMIWRRWRRKASNTRFGHAFTPFGPQRLDNALAAVFGLRGDYVGDFRLLDYLVATLSTHESPALDGKLGNWGRLKSDLGRMGVFDPSMSTYLLYRQREHQTAGYSGFEGRYYSVFESFRGDLAPAVDLQHFLTHVAFWLIAKGKIDHGDIPDTPFDESERRQIFFGTAIGIPTFFLKKDSGNRFLLSLAGYAPGRRSSHRYPGSIRISNREYRLGLIEYLFREALEPVEALGMEGKLEDLRKRIAEPNDFSAEGRMVSSILEGARRPRPMSLDAGDFNLRAEKYYRETLKDAHIAEALGILREWCAQSRDAGRYHDILDGVNASDLSGGRCEPALVRFLIGAVVTVVLERGEEMENDVGSGREASVAPVR